MKFKTNMKAIMYKKGVIDCKKLGVCRSKNPAYLRGFGRQYEREACSHG